MANLSFNPEDYSLMIDAIQRYRQVQERMNQDNDYPDAELKKRHEQIDHLNALEEKLYEALDAVEN